MKKFWRSILTVAVCCVAAASQEAVPRVIGQVDLGKYGYETRPIGTDKEFFNDYSIGKLLALDTDHVATLSNDITVVYGTRVSAGDSISLKAYFIQARTGKLDHYQEWHVSPRLERSDLLDGTNRIYGLHDGKFMVALSRALVIYDSDYKIIKESPIDADVKLFSIQIMNRGSIIFLRRQLATGAHFSWLDVDSLEPLRTLQSDKFSTTGVVALKESVMFPVLHNGIESMTLDGSARPACGDDRCSSAILFPLSSDSFLVMARGTVMNMMGDGKIVWSKQNSAMGGKTWHNFVPVALHSLDGSTIALDVAGNGFYDGVKLKSSGVWMIYEAQTGRFICAIPFATNQSGDAGFSVSPGGSYFASLNGTTLRFGSIH